MIQKIFMEFSNVESTSVPESVPEGASYGRYRALGGIINEQAYESALARAQTQTTLAEPLRMQVAHMAMVAGIPWENTPREIDPKTMLYGILRSDKNSDKAKYHHEQMNDLQLFAEALRMLGDTDSLVKLARAHPSVFS